MKNNINILLSKPFVQDDIDYLSDKVPGVVFFRPDDFDDLNVKKYVESLEQDIHVVLGPPPSADVLDNIKDSLKFVQVPWAGVDSVMLDDCEKLNITVCNSHGNASSVAEMAVTLLLSCSKRIPFHDSELRKGLWHRPGDDLGFYPPEEVKKSTVGLFGYGAINKMVASMLQGFDVSVIACTKNPINSSHVNKSYLVDNDFDEFLSISDYIVVGAPLTSETKNIFNHEQFGMMKSNSILINISRGGLVSDEALFYALSNNLIGGAAIDTWNVSPPRDSERRNPSEIDFSRLNNIVMSPHRAGFLRGELPHLNDVVENLRRLARQQNLINIIDIKNGY